jgi:N utilization substance protein A
MRGSRIHGIIHELRNESIDVVNYSPDPVTYIQRALSPAKVVSITIYEKTKKADVFMKPDQVSLAIGKGGYNIKLAGKLTGYEIDVYRDSDIENEDVDLQEFHDEIEQWIIDALLSIGCDTAKSVLALSVEDTMKRADLEEETVLEVRRILTEEFES